MPIRFYDVHEQSKHTLVESTMHAPRTGIAVQNNKRKCGAIRIRLTVKIQF